MHDVGPVTKQNWGSFVNNNSQAANTLRMQLHIPHFRKPLPAIATSQQPNVMHWEPLSQRRRAFSAQSLSLYRSCESPAPRPLYRASSVPARLQASSTSISEDIWRRRRSADSHYAVTARAGALWAPIDTTSRHVSWTSGYLRSRRLASYLELEQCGGW